MTDDPTLEELKSIALSALTIENSELKEARAELLDIVKNYVDHWPDNDLYVRARDAVKKYGGK